MTGSVLKEYILKLVVLGDAAVGKTSLINQYMLHSFKEDYKPTLGVNILTKVVKIEDYNVRLILWDLAAQSKYELSRKLFFQGCSGALLVYDVTRYTSFSNVKEKWYEDFIRYALPETGGNYLLIGNKVDLADERTVTTEEGEKMANKLNVADFIETSAKNGKNVDSTFKTLVLCVLRNKGVKILQ
ncbi:MAG: GTP-binding protein [Candidatus Lokiarchaeota archaeon]|nr:GTP-binding protein [Candidatus Lokiarchaeota archaeon]